MEAFLQLAYLDIWALEVRSKRKPKTEEEGRGKAAQSANQEPVDPLGGALKRSFDFHDWSWSLPQSPPAAPTGYQFPVCIVSCICQLFSRFIINLGSLLPYTLSYNLLK